MVEGVLFSSLWLLLPFWAEPDVRAEPSLPETSSSESTAVAESVDDTWLGNVRLVMLHGVSQGLVNSCYAAWYSGSIV